MRISIHDLMNQRNVLAGSAEGHACLVRLLAEAREPEAAEPLFLDFQGVDVATASFLRDGPLAFRQIVRARGSRLYPLFANLPVQALDELRLFVEATGDAVWVCELQKDLPLHSRLVGNLDEKQAETLKLVQERKEVDASTLAQEGETKANAWSNRLAGLVRKGLIIEFERGRSKVFRPVLSEV